MTRRGIAGALVVALPVLLPGGERAVHRIRDGGCRAVRSHGAPPAQPELRVP